ncbi:MAG TPA: ABC transporter substrate-binding protein, partial [Methylophilus sp.]
MFANESVRLQLKWHHQFQFAGYYAAKWQGYYQDEGLDVDIIEGHAQRPPLQSVLHGQAEYGIADSDLLLSRLKGQPVVALAAIFQHSPYVLLSLEKNNIHLPQDLLGKRIMLSKDQGEAQFHALLRKQQLDERQMKILPHSWRLQDLIDGKVDVLSGYAMDEPVQLQQMGYATSIISNQKYGVDFYGDVLFTTQQELAAHPERVAKFVRATKRGWAYALAHRSKMASQIAEMPGVAKRGIDESLLLKEADMMAPYVLTNVVTLGHMDLERWRAIAASLAEQGMIPAHYDISGFVYQPRADALNFKWLLQSSLALLVVLGFSFLWNLQIRRQVIHRTQALQNEIDRRKAAESLLKIAGNVAQIGGWLMDVKTGVVTWSDQVAIIHEMPVGYSPTVDEGIEMFVPEYRDSIKQAVLGCLADGTPYDLELEKITATGRRIWVRTMGQAVRDADGKIIRLQGSFQDITARKRMEAIQQGQARIKTMMLANLPLADILSVAVQLIEAQLPEVVCAIYLQDKDGARLRHAASSRLPADCVQTIDSVSLGGCSMLGPVQRRLIVADVSASILAPDHQQSALMGGLQSFWMTSLFSRSQRSLGALVLYRRQPCVPEVREIEFVESYAQILGLAIERQQSDEHLDLLQSGISRLNDIFMVIEAPLQQPMQQKIVFLNQAFSKITGIAAEDMIGASPFDIFAANTTEAVMVSVEQAFQQMQPVKAEMVICSPHGKYLSLEMDAVPLHDQSGWYTHWVAVMRDVTGRKQAEAQIRQLAYYDTMTGLPNRLLLQEKLAARLERMQPSDGSGALLFVDIDNFKSLNDTYGHDVGDALLVEVAKRMVGAVRSVDIVSRLGGDEFVVVLSHLSLEPSKSATQTRQVCEKILQAFKQPFNLYHYQHYTSPSIGVVLFNAKMPSTTDELLRRADLAMYKAKEAGRNTYRIFDASMETGLRERVSMEADLHVAIQQKQFLLHFQPQYDQEQQISGAEVLVRWQHPEQGL